MPVGLGAEQTTTEPRASAAPLGGSRSVEDPGAYSFELLTPKGGIIGEGSCSMWAPNQPQRQQHDGKDPPSSSPVRVETRWTPDRSYVLRQAIAPISPDTFAIRCAAYRDPNRQPL